MEKRLGTIIRMPLSIDSLPRGLNPIEKRFNSGLLILSDIVNSVAFIWD